jgi:hypothetical protein
LFSGSSKRASLATLAAALLAAAALAGCGLGPGPVPTGVHLTVTRDFGAQVLAGTSAPKASGEETVMSLLLRNAKITTKYGGGFVESIDGHSGGEAGGEPTDWFYYVNGIEAPKGAAATNVHPGDHIWWDLHDWSQTDEVPAVVGSYPEPFLNGSEGKRLPVRVECAAAQSAPCRTVIARLRALGVPAAVAAIGSGAEPDALQVVVGRWTAIHGDPSVTGIESGPRTSGVYARFAPNGQTLTLLGGDGSATATLTAGAGLVAATKDDEGAIVWVVSGTDEAGVARAARAFDASSLENKFALAVASTGAQLPVPGAGGEK